MGKRKMKNETSKKKVIVTTPILQEAEDSINGDCPSPVDCEETVDEVDLGKLQDITVTEVDDGTCAEDDFVEPEDKLKTLGIIHPCGGTRFYNRMFPDIPFQYIGKNPAFLGLAVEHHSSPLENLSSTDRTPERYAFQEIFSLLEDGRIMENRAPVKNGIANILRKNPIQKKFMNQKEVPVQSFGNAFDYEYGDFEAIEITTFGENDLLRSNMCNVDSFFISNPGAAHPFPVPEPGAHSSTIPGRFGESVYIQNQRAEVEDVGIQMASSNNTSNTIEVIDLSDE